MCGLEEVGHVVLVGRKAFLSIVNLRPARRRRRGGVGYEAFLSIVRLRPGWRRASMRRWSSDDVSRRRCVGVGSVSSEISCRRWVFSRCRSSDVMWVVGNQILSRGSSVFGSWSGRRILGGSSRCASVVGGYGLVGVRLSLGVSRQSWLGSWVVTWWVV